MKKALKLFVTCSLLFSFGAVGLTGCDSLKSAPAINNEVFRFEVKDLPVSDIFLQLIAAKDRRVKRSDSLNTEMPNEKVVYLTFDDGPSENTPKILEILDRYDVKATWFVLGTSGSFDYVSDIWEAGHQVAVHTNTHVYNEIYASPEAFWNDFNATREHIKQQIGVDTTLFRFPGGSINDYNRSVRDQIFEDAKSNHLHFFDWNVDSGDASGNGVAPDKLLQGTKNTTGNSQVCCVLMHDLETKGTTVEALPSIIEFYQSEGYTFDVLTSSSFGFHQS